MSFPLAEGESQIAAVRQLCYHALALRDAGLPHTKEAAMCKWMGPRNAFDVIHQCLLTFGHYGWSKDLPHQQRMRDVMGLENRRRHGADHEADHRPRTHRPHRRAVLTAARTLTSTEPGMPYQSIYRAGLFAGQTIIVTGGGSGIGRCTAHELASLGAHVALVGRKIDKLEAVCAEISDDGGSASTHVADIREEAQVIAVIDELLRHARPHRRGWSTTRVASSARR